VNAIQGTILEVQNGYALRNERLDISVFRLRFIGNLTVEFISLQILKIMKNKSSKISFKLVPFFLIALIIVAFGLPKYSLVGKWTIYNSDGTSIVE
jgi:hypothetical protein